MTKQITVEDFELLKRIVFMRMHDLSDRVHSTGGFAQFLFGEEIVATDKLFERLAGEHEAERCRQEWRKIVQIGAEAYADDLAERGYC